MDVRLADGDAGIGREAHDLSADHAGQDAAVDGRRAQLSADEQEQVGRGGLVGPAFLVDEQRVVGTRCLSRLLGQPRGGERLGLEVGGGTQGTVTDKRQRMIRKGPHFSLHHDRGAGVRRAAGDQHATGSVRHTGRLREADQLACQVRPLAGHVEAELREAFV